MKRKRFITYIHVLVDRDTGWPWQTVYIHHDKSCKVYRVRPQSFGRVLRAMERLCKPGGEQ